MRFDSGLTQVFWHGLLEALIRSSEIEPRERKIALTAPWISDLPFTGSRWSTSALGDVFNGRPCARLSDLLGFLVNHEYRVTVVIAAPNGKYLRKTSSKMIRSEMEFLRRIAAKGVDAFLQPDFHGKNLITPFVAITGSANWTNNGLSGRLIENLSLSRRDVGAEQEDFLRAWASFDDTFDVDTMRRVHSSSIEIAEANDIHAITVECDENERYQRIRSYLHEARDVLQPLELGQRLLALLDRPTFGEDDANLAHDLLRLIERDRDFPI